MQEALEAVLPTSRVSVVQRTGCVAARYGLKHRRSIVLQGWQSAIVGEMPGRFLRGLFHSDGCRITNWTARTVAGVEKRYGWDTISVARREAVEIMDREVGPKT